jgi:hypothetical protein
VRNEVDVVLQTNMRGSRYTGKTRQLALTIAGVLASEDGEEGNSTGSIWRACGASSRIQDGELTISSFVTRFLTSCWRKTSNREGTRRVRKMS